MNALDAAIVFFLFAVVWRGMRTGILRLVAMIFGFFGGLYIASIVVGYTVSRLPNELIALMLSLVVLVLGASTAANACERLAITLDQRTKRFKLDSVNQVFGGTTAFVAGLIVTWTLAATLSSVDTLAIAQTVRGSSIIKQLNTVLPPAPDTFYALEAALKNDPFPHVFIGNEPERQPVYNNTTIAKSTLLPAEQSVVRIKSNACGGVLAGTGFVVRTHVIMTNAHVIAGSDSPTVTANGRTYASSIIHFDPTYDIALLYVPRLTNPPLSFNTSTYDYGEPIATLGYPGVSGLTVEGGYIVEHLTVSGRTIYNRGKVERAVYQMQVDVERGDSGGPVLNARREVIGMVFGRSPIDAQTGYAIRSSVLQDIVDSYGTNRIEAQRSACVQK